MTTLDLLTELSHNIFSDTAKKFSRKTAHKLNTAQCLVIYLVATYREIPAKHRETTLRTLKKLGYIISEETEKRGANNKKVMKNILTYKGEMALENIIITCSPILDRINANKTTQTH